MGKVRQGWAAWCCSRLSARPKWRHLGGYSEAGLPFFPCGSEPHQVAPRSRRQRGRSPPHSSQWRSRIALFTSANLSAFHTLVENRSGSSDTPHLLLFVHLYLWFPCTRARRDQQGYGSSESSAIVKVQFPSLSAQGEG